MTNEQFGLINDKLINRLKSLNYTYDEKDDFALRFCADKAEHTIMNGINDSVIPEELQEVFIDMACGEFLYMKDSSLTDEEKSMIVKRITTGEETVEFDAASQKIFINYVNELRTSGEKQFSRYRKLVW